MQGRSMVPMLMGKAESVHGDEPVMGWELFGRRAIRKGDWKLVWTTEPYGPGDWELINLADDPGEIHDLSTDYPEHKLELLELWETYVRDNGVILSTEPLAY
jgi:arylsulfatase